MTKTAIPESLKIPYRSDYRRGWMLRNDRTKSVTISSEQLVYLLVALRHSDADLVRELLGEQTCEAALEKHTKKSSDD